MQHPQATELHWRCWACCFASAAAFLQRTAPDAALLQGTPTAALVTLQLLQVPAAAAAVSTAAVDTVTLAQGSGAGICVGRDYVLLPPLLLLQSM